MVDGGYSMDEIFKVERFMFIMLYFEFGWFGLMSFLCCVSKVDDYDFDIWIFVKYFFELIIMDECFVVLLLSFFVVVVYCLLWFIFRKGDWVCFFLFCSV